MSDRASLPQRLRDLIRNARPFAYCNACLALRLDASLDEITTALAALSADPSFERRRRACYGCGRTLELTTLRDDARG